MARERDAEPEHRGGRDEERVQHAHARHRNHLAGQELRPRDGRDHQALQRAELALPHDDHRAQHQRRDEDDVGHDARHEIPAVLQVGIEPGALLDHHARPQAAGGRRLLRDDACDLRGDQLRAVRIGAVRDQLQGARAREALRDLQDHAHLRAIDPGAGIAQVGRHAQRVVAGRHDGGQHVAARTAAVVVDDGDVRMAHVEGRGIAEQQELDQRRYDEHEAHPRIAQQLQELLAQQGAKPHRDAPESRLDGRLHARSPRPAARRTSSAASSVAITASDAVSTHSVARVAPFRNSALMSAT